VNKSDSQFSSVAPSSSDQQVMVAKSDTQPKDDKSKSSQCLTVKPVDMESNYESPSKAPLDAASGSKLAKSNQLSG